VYMPIIGRSQPIGHWEPRFGDRTDFERMGPTDIFPLTGAAIYAVTNSDKLKREAAALEKQVAELRERRVDRTGDPAETLDRIIREVTLAPASVVEEAA
jgi:hypothetical protein